MSSGEFHAGALVALLRPTDGSPFHRQVDERLRHLLPEQLKASNGAQGVSKSARIGGREPRVLVRTKLRN